MKNIQEKFDQIRTLLLAHYYLEKSKGNKRKKKNEM